LFAAILWYGIISISLPVIDTVKKYVENQKFKHKLKETEALIKNKKKIIEFKIIK